MLSGSSQLKTSLKSPGYFHGTCVNVLLLRCVLLFKVSRSQKVFYESCLLLFLEYSEGPQESVLDHMLFLL